MKSNSYIILILTIILFLLHIFHILLRYREGYVFEIKDKIIKADAKVGVDVKSNVSVL